MLSFPRRLCANLLVQFAHSLCVTVSFTLIRRFEHMAPILIVDDSEEDLILAERIVRQCKILNPVYTFKTGKECLNFFERPGAEDVPPCIIFLDLVMKPMDGLDVLASLSFNPIAARSLIVMLSGLTDIKAVHTGYQLGAHTFLIKPLKQEDVLRTVEVMQNHLKTEKLPEGYIIHLVPDTDTTFIKKSHLKEFRSEVAI
jgi:CheY-like chemotaxis protein